jgi:hypothetical protein
MQEKGLNVDVVEIDAENCQWIISEHPWIKNVYCYGIVNWIGLGVVKSTWEVVLWSHGIEMVQKKYASALMTGFNNLCDSVIVHMTPYGSCGGTGNIEAWYPEEFQKYGYQTDTIGKLDVRNSNLLAWKRI